MATKKSIKDFAAGAAPSRGSVCCICSLEPAIRQEIDEAYRDGITRTIVYRWATSEHPELKITLGKLDHHTRSQHHKED